MAEENININVNYGDEGSDGGTGGGGGGGGDSATQELKKAAPVWQNVGKFILSMLGVTSALTFVIQAFKRSKILSTMTDSLLTTLSAVVDLLLLPLVPIFIPVLQMIISFLPTAAKLGQKIAEFIKDPWGSIKKIFEGIAGGLGGIGGIGARLIELGSEIKGTWSDAFTNILGIWGNDGLTFWEKIGQTASTIWDAIKTTGSLVWTFIKNEWENNIFPFIHTKWDEFWSPEGFGGKKWAEFTTWFEDKTGLDIDNLFGKSGSIATKWKEFWDTGLGGIAIDSLFGESGKIHLFWDGLKTDVNTLFGPEGNIGKIFSAIDLKWALTLGLINQLFSEYGPIATKFADIKTRFDSVTNLWSATLETAKSLFGTGGFIETFFTESGAGGKAIHKTLVDVENTFISIYNTIKVSVGNVLLTAVNSMSTLADSLMGELYHLSPLGDILTAMAKIAGSIVNEVALKGYATGTDYVPRTGLYKLHEGEKVIPANQNSNNKSISISNVFNISGNNNDSLLPQKISDSLESSIRDSYLRSY